mmetsp:Transcript_14078/g.20616  ORF Transcript_14078/g.20616 Transcript_14078/m.20616 type:complete len:261 (+) Transcript_14078:816-1598(+)
MTLDGWNILPCFSFCRFNPSHHFCLRRVVDTVQQGTKEGLMTYPGNKGNVNGSTFILLGKELLPHSTTSFKEGCNAASTKQVDKVLEPTPYLILEKHENLCQHSHHGGGPNSRIKSKGGKHDSMGICLRYNKVIDIEHFRELLHGKILLHGSVRKVCRRFGTFKAFGTVGVFDNELVGFKDTRQRGRSNGCTPNEYVRCCEVVEQPWWVRGVIGSDSNVEDASSAIKGLLKSKVTHVCPENLTKVLCVVRQHVLRTLLES